jgi:hypothetical protein
MQRLCRLLQQPGFHALTFVFFLFILVWPVLSIPGKSQLTAFFAYLFAIWALMVFALFFLNRCLGNANPDEDEDEDRQEQGGEPRV